LGGRVDVEKVRLEENERAGLAVAQLGDADLLSGQISSNAIGVSIRLPNFDLTKITRLVRFDENDVTILVEE
jgi:hypothetical protein